MCVTEEKLITINSALCLIGGNKGGGRGGGTKGSHFRADHPSPLLDGNPTNTQSDLKKGFRSTVPVEALFLFS